MKKVKIRFFVILALFFWALYNVIPTFIYLLTPIEIRDDKEKMEKIIPFFLPKHYITFGLDIRGGSLLVLGVDTSDALNIKLDSFAVEMRKLSDDSNWGIKSAYVLKDKNFLKIELNSKNSKNKILNHIKKDYKELTLLSNKQNQLIYKFIDSDVISIKKAAVKQAEKVIRDRVYKWGTEPIINLRQDDSILVQLPGFKNPQKAKELLGKTAKLNFHMVDESFGGFDDIRDKMPDDISISESSIKQIQFVSKNKDKLVNFLKSHVPENKLLLFEKKIVAGKDTYTSWVVDASAVMDGTAVQNARAYENPQTLWPEIALDMTPSGARRFYKVTGDNINKLMAIVLDGNVQAAPQIQEKLSKTARITLGKGKSKDQVKKEAEDLALILKSGSVPATINVLEEREIGASLGPQLANQGLIGVILGIFLVIVFILYYYRYTGIIATLILIFNGVFLLSLMAGFEFALTLPGIAGFILTLGMAVDANVLINERIRQELAVIKNVKKAVELAFDKVIWTILDSNITTLIAAIVLFETNSSGPIKGFAITLILGILVSLFTSLYCNRIIFRLILNKFKDFKTLKRILGFRENQTRFNFDFLKYSKSALIISLSLVFIIFVKLLYGGINFGVDFSGGSEIRLKFNNKVSSESIKEAAEKAGAKNITIQSIGNTKNHFLLRFDYKDQKEKSIELKSDFQKSLVSSLEKYQGEILRNDYVGPQIGNELRNQGLLSLLYAIIGILIYIVLRFNFNFVPGAIIKVVLDVSVMSGFYIIFYRSFDLTSVAAFLTVIGYSVNDTIVIYDRIREKLSSKIIKDLYEVINESLSETLTRTFNTSITTIASLIGVLVFASGQIWDFAMAMTLGVVIATFSSIFISSYFVILTRKFIFKN